MVASSRGGLVAGHRSGQRPHEGSKPQVGCRKHPVSRNPKEDKVDWKRLDRARRSATPVELDLIEAYAQGRVTRRQFVKRGTVIGLSLPFMSAIVAACGGGDAAPVTTSAPAAPATTGAPGTTQAPVAGGTLRVAIQRPASALDPVAMQDLGNYGVIAMALEYLVTLDGDDIGPGLAESWTPNDDGSEWTFALRQGVSWSDGSPFTAADVVATMDRLVEYGNAGLKGVIDIGSTVATDDNTVTVTLLTPSGNFPFLVSLFNPQSAITPVSFGLGTTLDGTSTGTGPFTLASYNSATGASFVRNPGWWGGTTPLDGVEFVFFDEVGPQITAYQGGQIDVIQQFQVIGGDALFADPNFVVLAKQTAAHRQIWFRVDTGQFTDKRVRQALALTMDRPRMIEQLFKGKADIGNDHVIAPMYPFFDESVPQRAKDIDKAKTLLGEAGVSGLKAVLHCGELQEIPDLAVLMQSGAKEAGIELEVQVESLDTFYGSQWCPGEPADPPCSGAAELGIVDYGHRSVPDVYLNAALSTGGIWNSSQYANPAFDAAFKAYQAAIGVDAQKVACKTIEELLNDEVPVAVPYHYNYLAGYSNKFTGIEGSALGQLFLGSASQV